MSPELWIALIGQAINFGLLMIHCRRDRRRFKEMDK